jgi:arabinoxylan arabinofuranohydrolase
MKLPLSLMTAILLLITILNISAVNASNPIVPFGTYYADPEPHVWADGVVYLYCSHDINGTTWCSDDYHVFSSSDLIHWTDRGIAFSVPGTTLYANDCAYKDGVYYLYYATPDGKCFVATSPSPTGPFAGPVQLAGISGIDPAVYIDDDGQAYIYWGQFDNVRCAKMNSDMKTVDFSTQIQPLTVAKDNFHEGSSMIKRAGTYYYVYADTSRHGGKPTSLGYATGPTPMGPFTYRGVIIDSIGCDPNVWNNHGRIIEMKGKWYVFYHRSTHAGPYLREICVEPITFNTDGSISEVEMTSQGTGSPLKATSPIRASAACLLSGTVHVQDSDDGGMELTAISPGDYAAYKYVDFGRRVESFSAKVAGGAVGGIIEVRLDGPLGNLIGRLAVSTSLSPDQASAIETCPVHGVSGVHALYLRFLSPDNRTDMSINGLNILWFEFQ